MLNSLGDTHLPTPEPMAGDYRRLVGTDDLVRFRVKIEQTDLLISAEQPLIEEAVRLVRARRQEIKAYIGRHPEFMAALAPLEVARSAPPIVKSMAWAAERVGVGPMAAVAGAIAEYVGAELRKESPEIIVENGGDVYCASARERNFLLLAEKSAFGALTVKIKGDGQPFGACTSSGTSGHSLSFGRADAVMAIAADAALADAAATALANTVRTPADVEKCVALAQSFGLRGIVAVAQHRLAAWGAVELGV